MSPFSPYSTSPRPVFSFTTWIFLRRADAAIPLRHVPKASLTVYTNDISDLYEMRERLGDGAASIVYRAISRQTKEEVAIKVLRADIEDPRKKRQVIKPLFRSSSQERVLIL